MPEQRRNQRMGLMRRHGTAPRTHQTHPIGPQTPGHTTAGDNMGAHTTHLTRPHSPYRRTGAPNVHGQQHARTHGAIGTHVHHRDTERLPHGGEQTPRVRSGRPHKTRQPEKRLVHHRISVEESAIIPPIGDAIRIIPLGGVEEIGRNMTVIEYQNDIVIVDMGFQFKEENTPGIDYILPNTKYLEDRKDKIRAVIITHGHLDHVGGIPYMMGKIGNPPIYSRYLTTLLIRKRQEEFPGEQPLDIRVVEKEDAIVLSDTMRLRFFSVTHTIPDSMGVIIDTPYGSIVHTGDLKLRHENSVPVKEEEETFGKFKKEKILLLMADSTNVERPGFSIPEDTVNESLKRIITESKGRIFIGSFSSQLERAMKIIEYGEKAGRKIVVEGRSMKVNLDIARESGYLKHGDKTVIPLEDIEKYDPKQLLILATGSQGEEFAALMRISNKTHKYLRIRPDDIVVLSSSIVPGNERSVQRLKDNLSRQGAHIIHYQVSDVHSSGHANRDETAWIHKHINPRFFVPMHGYHYMLTVHADIARSVGIPSSHIIIPDNSMVIEIRDKGERIVALPEKAPSNIVMVDGFSVGDIQHVVLRDRQTLAQDGMFVIVATVDMNTGKLRKSPDIISRGFVYLRESQELLREARGIIKKTVEGSLIGMHPMNFDFVRDKLSDDLSRFLLQKTAKRPIVIPVLLGV